MKDQNYSANDFGKAYSKVFSSPKLVLNKMTELRKFSTNKTKNCNDPQYTKSEIKLFLASTMNPRHSLMVISNFPK